MLVPFVLLTHRSIPFTQENQKINAERAEVAEVAEKSHSKAKILCGLCALCVKAFRLRIFRTMSFVAAFARMILEADIVEAAEGSEAAFEEKSGESHHDDREHKEE
jgi:hypothetical protein